jgi:hypothetical protein
MIYESFLEKIGVIWTVIGLHDKRTSDLSGRPPIYGIALKFQSLGKPLVLPVRLEKV